MRTLHTESVLQSINYSRVSRSSTVGYALRTLSRRFRLRDALPVH